MRHFLINFFVLATFFLLISQVAKAGTNSSKNEADSYLKSLCTSCRDIDSIIFYYIDFTTNTPFSITRHKFVNYSIYGSSRVDYKKTLYKSERLKFKAFFSKLNNLECDSIMPYDTQHVNCRLFGGKNGVVLSREEVGGDVRCMVILYRKENIELVWLTTTYAFIGKGRFTLTDDLRNFVDKICRQNM